MDGRTDIWDPLMLLGRLGGVDLKTISSEEMVQAKVREDSQEEKVELQGIGFADLWNRWVLIREWKREGVMNEQSGETDEEEVMGEGIGE